MSIIISGFGSSQSRVNFSKPQQPTESQLKDIRASRLYSWVNSEARVPLSPAASSSSVKSLMELGLSFLRCQGHYELMADQRLTSFCLPWQSPAGIRKTPSLEQDGFTADNFRWQVEKTVMQCGGFHFLTSINGRKMSRSLGGCQVFGVKVTVLFLSDRSLKKKRSGNLVRRQSCLPESSLPFHLLTCHSHQGQMSSHPL